MLTLEDLQRRRLESLRRYMVPGERVLTATHHHWAVMIEPVASATAGLVLVGWLDASLTSADAVLANALWWAWFVLVGRMLWRFLERQDTWFVSTDKRLLLSYGLFNHKVAMMPMAKVTDMSYNRSVLGRLFGYGTFVLESAGQDQALREIPLVPRPDYVYRTICAVMFGSSDNEDQLGGSNDPGADRTDPGGGAPRGRRRGGPAGGSGSGGQGRARTGRGPLPPGGQPRSGPHLDPRRSEGTTDYTAAAQHALEATIRPVQEPEHTAGSLYRSADLHQKQAVEDARAQGQADTGPIPVQRPRRRR